MNRATVELHSATVADVSGTISRCADVLDFIRRQLHDDATSACAMAEIASMMHDRLKAAAKELDDVEVYLGRVASGMEVRQ